ncbi:hypothetical protein QCB44_07635 [Thiomicrorhabdus sp. zzn3]|uniref:hypothetical protein n=1 Tax=Thiomicrorhabdus sp. zzn3 TaxID=3039775 RepID=UPI0024366C61|nr:hypothetical protein [Thiomicrorhabdus sp. zzn3]MDG6778572.1 hypothetical protein [Thiomicrorhabdus sp. zzn3]
MAILIGIFAGLWQLVTEKQQELKKIETVKFRELNSLRSQVNFLQQQVKLYKQYGEKYKDLVRKGIVKQQDRVFWADSLIQMQKTLVMPEFTFQFTPEQALDSNRFSGITVDKGFFYFSRLNLNMALQHDGDLPKLLNAINERISPFYLVDHCSYTLHDDKEVKKTKDEWDGKEFIQPAFDPESGNIDTECSLVVFHTHSKLAKNL